MPRMVGQKRAVGQGNGDCPGCLEPITRGQRITGVSEGQEFKGWFCDECIRTFDPPVEGATVSERPEPLFTDGRETDEQKEPQ